MVKLLMMKLKNKYLMLIRGKLCPSGVGAPKALPKGPYPEN
jgi:hypothetical protein